MMKGFNTTNCRRCNLVVLLAFLVTLLLMLPYSAGAQDEQPTTDPREIISDDQLNAVAGKLYCPVCEGIPLEDCGTVTCIDWKEEIRSQMASGMSEQEVIDAFVARYGEQVVGVPQDPTLRAISLVTPWLAALAVIVIGVWVFLRWRRSQTTVAEFAGGVPDQPDTPDDEYRSRLERDLKSRR